MYLAQAAALYPTSIKPVDAKCYTLFVHWNQSNRQQVYFVWTDIWDAFGSVHNEKLWYIEEYFWR